MNLKEFKKIAKEALETSPSKLVDEISLVNIDPFTELVDSLIKSKGKRSIRDKIFLNKSTVKFIIRWQCIQLNGNVDFSELSSLYYIFKWVELI